MKSVRWFRKPKVQSDGPLERWLSYTLAYAYTEKATAIIFGNPRELPPEMTGSDAGFGDDEELEAAGSSTTQEAVAVAIDRSSHLKNATGRRQLPVWVRIGGKLYSHIGPPITVYPALLNEIDNRLVSFGASVSGPKPRRYLEYRFLAKTEERCFTEVELWMDEDNTVRLEIIGHRREPDSVNARHSVT